MRRIVQFFCYLFSGFAASLCIFAVYSGSFLPLIGSVAIFAFGLLVAFGCYCVLEKIAEVEAEETYHREMRRELRRRRQEEYTVVGVTPSVN